LSRLHLGFLQAEKVGIKLLKNIAETLVATRTNAVDVPRNEFHTCVVIEFTRKSTQKVSPLHVFTAEIP
jgi:hypothetical protein